MKDLKTLIKTPLTDRNMRQLFPFITKDKIIEYSDLEHLKDIEDLLTHDKDYRIVLIEYEQNSGHWILISRYGDTLELFNSYGKKHGKNDFVNDKELNKYLGQATLHLKRLLDLERADHKFNVIYNKKKMQKESLVVNTCGHHVLVRLLTMLQGLDLEQYLRFMKISKDKYKLRDYDELVVTILY